jgi:nucleotide-binding universal stress UspA family protein
MESEMIKQIFVPLIESPGDEAALTTALALAAALPAELSVQVIIEQPLPMAPEYGLVPDALYMSQIEDARRRGQDLVRHARQRLALAGVKGDVRIGDGYLLSAARSAALAALHADLAVMGGSEPGQLNSTFEHFFADILRSSGRAVMVVPPAHPAALPIRRAVIAWQPTAEARRAVHESLPLIASADSVDVLMIDPVVGGVGSTQPPGEDVVALLARHGRTAHIVIQRDTGIGTAAALLRHASSVRAELLVAGGYSHSRVRELILGGVTRDLLRSAPLAVLYSH